MKLVKLSKRRRMLIVAATLVVLFVLLFSLACSFYSLERLSSYGEPTDNAPRTKEGYVFSLPVQMEPAYRLPILFEKIVVRDQRTMQELAPLVYVYDVTGYSDNYTSGHITMLDFMSQYGNRIHSAKGFYTSGDNLCIVALFEALPPQENGVYFEIYYKLFGFIQKKDSIRLAWEQ